MKIKLIKRIMDNIYLGEDNNIYLINQKKLNYLPDITYVDCFVDYHTIYHREIKTHNAVKKKDITDYLHLII